MGVKVLAVTLNKEHAQTLTKIITKFMQEHIQAGSAHFLGNDGENRLKDTMLAKLRPWQLVILQVAIPGHFLGDRPRHLTRRSPFVVACAPQG